MILTFKVNGEEKVARVKTPVSLLDLLRDDVGLAGTKSACEQGECGSCSVLLDGVLVCSCLVMATDVEGSEVVTVEGIGAGTLHPVQTAMHEAGAVQCGFCTPGFVVAAAELFDRNPTPSTNEIKEALAGNICRCTGYGAIVRAFEKLSEDSK